MLLPYLNKGVIEAGCDEAGRGCLAGPVYAAAVILPPDYHNEMLNDSKQLTEKRRYQLRDIIERDALAWAVGIVDNHEIDEINILRASILAKTYRDDCMLRLHSEYPQYHWDRNKGYPAPAHRDAIRHFGATPYHRMTFNLLGSPQLEFDFGH